jgi:hypothetical protein
VAFDRNFPDFIFKDIQDNWVRENFFRLDKFIKKFTLFKGNWVFFEYDFQQALTNQKMAHSLGFKPTDIIQTSVIGPGVLTFNYELFDKTNFDITTTGPCRVRFFAGAYREGT